MSKDRLLSYEELHAKIMRITGGHLYGHQNKDLLDLINTQKRLYAESVLDDVMRLRAEQRARIKWMTNYNERLEQQLFRVLTKGGLEKEKEIESKGRYIHRPMKSIVHEEVEAINSLIKELVAEAKPARAIISDDEMGIDRARKSAANHAIDQFEQNLLKALEEK